MDGIETFGGTRAQAIRIILVPSEGKPCLIILPLVKSLFFLINNDDFVNPKENTVYNPPNEQKLVIN